MTPEELGIDSAPPNTSQITSGQHLDLNSTAIGSNQDLDLHQPVNKMNMTSINFFGVTSDRYIEPPLHFRSQTSTKNGAQSTRGSSLIPLTTLNQMTDLAVRKIHETSG